MSDALVSLRVAHTAKLEREASLAEASTLELQAVARAHWEGASLQAIGDVIGISRQGVLYLLKRDGAHVPAEARAVEQETKRRSCEHLRVYSWVGSDGAANRGCSDCGAVLPVL